ncbi:hypothetical protein CYMTET_29301, partial [Cymbomonas tetramitiformis]
MTKLSHTDVTDRAEFTRSLFRTAFHEVYRRMPLFAKDVVAHVTDMEEELQHLRKQLSEASGVVSLAEDWKLQTKELMAHVESLEEKLQGHYKQEQENAKATSQRDMDKRSARALEEMGAISASNTLRQINVKSAARALELMSSTEAGAILCELPRGSAGK